MAAQPRVAPPTPSTSSTSPFEDTCTADRDIGWDIIAAGEGLSGAGRTVDGASRPDAKTVGRTKVEIDVLLAVGFDVGCKCVCNLVGIAVITVHSPPHGTTPLSMNPLVDYFHS